jgi:hypothetical protein
MSKRYSRRAAKAEAIVDDIKPHLAGQDPDMVGAVIGELLATFIASHHPAARQETFDLLTKLATDLVPIIVEGMIKAGRCGEDWREEIKQ